MNEHQATRLVDVLEAAYPRKPLPAETRRLYIARLKPLQYESAHDALVQCIDQCKFFPTIAELRDAYNQRAEVIASRQAAHRAEELPPLTPEQRQEGLRLLRELTARYGHAGKELPA